MSKARDLILLFLRESWAIWGLKMEAIWGIEARGITRVMDDKKNVARPLHDYFHMFSLWFSINLQAVNIIIGLLGRS
jgi:hypothetical protein